MGVEHRAPSPPSPRRSLCGRPSLPPHPYSHIGGLAFGRVEFFECWNRRDMEAAVLLFSEDVVYEDTVYPEVFEGRDALRFHLLRVADAVPDSFRFVIDDLSSGSAEATAVGARWHVELADGTALPFTRGCSFYKFNDQGLINSGFDCVEPSLKPGSASLALLSVASRVLRFMGR